MAVQVKYIPFQLSKTNYRLVLPFGDQVYLFDVRWNSRDAAHYLDIREADETPVSVGIKLVLGVNIGRLSGNRFFADRVFRVIDSEKTGVDASFDDLGRRVNLAFVEVDDIVGLTATS